MAPESPGFDLPDDLRAHAAWLRRLAVSLVGAGPDSEDAIQETWAAALASPPRDRAALRPWLATVLRNFVRLHARADRNRQRREIAMLSLAPSWLPSAEELLARHQSLSLLAAEVGRLEEPYRSTVLLCYAEDLAPAEIARRQGIPAATVRSRLKRGLAELRRRLQTGNERRSGWVIPAAKGLLVMKVSSKPTLVVIAAVLLLLAGAAWRLVATSRPGDTDAPSSSSVAAGRGSKLGPREGAGSIPRLRGTAVASAPADSTEVAATRTTTINGEDQPEVRLHGRILDTLRRPVAGAVVVARADLQAGMSTNAARGQSDGAGRYEIAGLRAGQLRVEAEHPRAGRGVGGPVRTSPGTAHEVDVILGRGFVRGAVTWPDGKPAGAVVVRGTVRGRVSLTDETDAAGRYEVGPFAVAEVTINAAPDADPVGAGADTARVVAIVPGQDAEGVDLVIPRREQFVSGVVLSPDGRPLPHVPIGIVRDERTPVFRSTADSLRAGGNYAALSDATGSFLVGGLPRATFTIWAIQADHPDAEARDVKAGTTGVRLQFLRGASLSGRTLDRSGEPCEAYSLHLGRVAPGGVPDFSASKDVSAGDGTFTFSALSPGAYELLARAPDGRIGRLRDLTLTEGQSRDRLTLVLDQGAQVSGRAIVGDTGEPLADVWLGSSIPGARARTDAGGFFVFNSMPFGSFSLYVPRTPRTMEAQDEVVTVPNGARQFDAGVLRVRR